MLFRTTVGVCAAAACTLPVVSPALGQVGPRYRLFDLGTLGGTSSVAYGLNDDGRVVGAAQTPTGERHAFVWHPSSAAEGPSGMTDLGAVGQDSTAVALNVAGQCVGWAAGGQTGGATGLVPLGVGMAPLHSAGPLNRYYDVRGINDNAEAVGSRRGRSGLQAVYVLGETIVELPTPSDAQGAQALAINAGSVAVGIVYGSDFPWHACVWQGGAMTDLGTLGGDRSEAYGINAAGQVVGVARTANAANHAFLWQTGAMIDLGTLGGDESAATGISTNGQIVGYSRNTGRALRASLWDNGSIYDLNACLPFAPAGWEVLQAFAVNKGGSIVGRGRTPGGAMHAFLLTPIVQNIDRDGNGEVNSDDLSVFLNQWVSDVVVGSFETDWDGDSDVSPNDLAEYAQAWFSAITGPG